MPCFLFLYILCFSSSFYRLDFCRQRYKFSELSTSILWLVSWVTFYCSIIVSCFLRNPAFITNTVGLGFQEFHCHLSMERSAVMKTLAKQPVFDMVEPPPPPFISFPQKTMATVRDASFSSYVKPQKHDSPVDDTEISIFDAQKYFNESNGGGSDPRVSKRVSPVNVVNLESIPRFSSASSSVDGYGRNYRARSFHATPTASSEASWNSQTGLLSHPPGAIAVSMRNPGGGGSADEKKKGSSKWRLGRKCPCAGKKSVQVEEKLSEPRTPPRLIQNKSKEIRNVQRKFSMSSETSSAATDWIQRQEIIIPNSRLRISADNNNNMFPSSSALGQHHQRVIASSAARDGFSFPILNQTSSSPPVKLLLNGSLQKPSVNFIEEPPRDSLEVFRPSDDPIKTTTADLLHQRQSFTLPTSPKSKMTVIDDDMASDASSDLFEIESFSTQTTSYQMYSNTHGGGLDSLDEAGIFSTTGRRLSGGGERSVYCRRSIDDEPMTPSIAPTECYEPSEASIDWSVTTAEGFERGSVTNFSVTASEADHQEMTAMMMMNTRRHENGGGKKRSGGGGGGGGLLSCRCEKAVSVGPHPVKCGGGEGQRGGMRHQHVSSRPYSAANKPPLAKSHSAHLSLPFAT
ncbi:protein PHYTOCHROME KINASE SUBSTRATE 4 [Mercurialis annua]|uniref:protein PHYTOCHROME KINASE SUBSTRATE 4 n=1 Tax=Mercurialis annua TaxID=3986 RepID=UPI00215E8E92|nr:protein PHYTOCHROME KINASE SUBSTRATE 4 [Mercurialis annua]